MTDWLNERYISRVEHQEVVEYYRKLVAQLHGNVKNLRTEIDAHNIANVVAHSKKLAERQGRCGGSNVVSVDFQRRP